MGLYVDIFNPRSWAHPPFNVDNITPTTGLYTIGVELPRWISRHHIIIVPTMTIGWIIVSALIKAQALS